MARNLERIPRLVRASRLKWFSATLTIQPRHLLGTSLVKLGRAHCKVATLQEAYALTFRDTFLTSIQNFGDDIKEYELLRKKLESRR